MEQVARVISLPTQDVGYRLNPTLHDRVKGNGRELAAAKLEELAARLRSGELDGVRFQWRDTHGCLVEVGGKQYDLTKGDAPDGQQQPISGLEFVTRTAWTDDGSGTVQYVARTIEEEGV